MATTTPRTITKGIDEPVAKKRLRIAVARRRRTLQLLMADIEETREELNTIKAEYDHRIGSLYLRLEEIDEEIFELRRLQDLLQKGNSYAEARRIMDERERVHRERTEAKDEEEAKVQEEITKQAKKMNPAERDELKKLWRQLAFRFHPDLVASDEEKRERERMMKRVNEAYTRGDLVALKALASEEAGGEVFGGDATMDDLERSLMDTEACIRRMKQKLKAFRRSEWYAWKEGIDKAKQKKQDFFAVHEKNTRKSVLAKERELTKLQETINTFR